MAYLVCWAMISGRWAVPAGPDCTGDAGGKARKEKLRTVDGVLAASLWEGGTGGEAFLWHTPRIALLQAGKQALATSQCR